MEGDEGWRQTGRTAEGCDEQQEEEGIQWDESMGEGRDETGWQRTQETAGGH